MRPSLPLPTSALAAALLLWPHALPEASAQLRQRAAPFTVRYDVNALLAERPQVSLPLWLQGTGVQRYRAEGELPARTVVRMHLRKIASLAPIVELRIGLSAGAGQANVVAWSETGREAFRSASFGSEDTHITEIVRIATAEADYIEVELPAKGERLSELYATAMRYTQVLQPVDFSPAPVSDPFENPATASTASKAATEDTLLWNRVHAPLDPGPFPLQSGASQTIEFQLQRRPECALVSFEMRNALADLPPVLALNQTELPAASLTLPDLADPAWKRQPQANASADSAQLQYSGWIRVQQFIPGAALLEGTNQLDISGGEETAEIRRVEIQLRYRR